MKNSTDINFQITPPLQIGIKEKNLKFIAEKLTEILSSNYILFLKTQKFHWNVKGENFISYHKFFEKTYLELLGLIDEIAERISMIGQPVPGSLFEFDKLSKLKEHSDDIFESQKMTLLLINDFELLIRLSREILEEIQDLKDDVTMELLTKNIIFYEKTNWALRNFRGVDTQSSPYSH